MLKRIFFGLFAFALRRLRLLPDAESSSSLPPRENTLDNRSEARLSALPGGRGAAPF